MFDESYYITVLLFLPLCFTFILYIFFFLCVFKSLQDILCLRSVGAIPPFSSTPKTLKSYSGDT